MRHLLLAASIFQVSRVKLLPQMPLLPDPFHFGLLSKCSAETYPTPLYEIIFHSNPNVSSSLFVISTV